MGLVYTEVTMKNAFDIGMARQGYIKDQDIRQITVEAQVDTGAWTMVINEETRVKLGLQATKTAHGRLADGKQSE